jgi:hypothetical protein
VRFNSDPVDRDDDGELSYGRGPGRGPAPGVELEDGEEEDDACDAFLPTNGLETMVNGHDAGDADGDADADGHEGFVEALHEFAGQDIAALRAYIASAGE